MLDITEKLQGIKEIAKDPFGSVETFLLSKLSNELAGLVEEPWMTEDDLNYVTGVQEKLSNGEYAGILRKALITTAICVPINNGPFFASLIGSAVLSIIDGENIALAGAKSIGVSTTTAIVSQAVAVGVMLASHAPKSLKELPLSLAIVAPSLLFVPLPGHTIATNLLGSLTLQNPKEFYRLTILEGKKLKNQLKQVFLKVAGLYEGMI